MIKADLLVNLEELKHYGLLRTIADSESISLVEAIDLLLSKVEVLDERDDDEEDYQMSIEHQCN